MNKHLIEKLDVAKIQIAEAIRLFYAERNIIVIHTVIAAAHQVLVDVGGHNNVYGILKNPNIKNKMEYKEYLKSVNFPYNFFKHADKDPNGKIDIAPLERFTQDFIMDAILMLQGLTKNIPLEAQVYWAWFVSSYPDEFSDCPKDGKIQKMVDINLNKVNFPTLLQFIKVGGFGP
jgi:hypothetical protein